MPTPDLAKQLVAEEPLIRQVVRRHGGSLLRLEGEADLVQGASLHALQRLERLEWAGEEAFRGWLRTLVRRYLADRFDFWSAARRNAGPLLRLTGVGGGTTQLGRGIDVATPRTGPRTFAERRDQWVLAARAIGTLLPRDQEILEAEREGVTVEELAVRLELQPETAGRARRRALDRFRRAYELLVRRGS